VRTVPIKVQYRCIQKRLQIVYRCLHSVNSFQLGCAISFPRNRDTPLFSQSILQMYISHTSTPQPGSNMLPLAHTLCLRAQQLTDARPTQHVLLLCFTTHAQHRNGKSELPYSGATTHKQCKSGRLLSVGGGGGVRDILCAAA
jgi:hypothetical protein